MRASEAIWATVSLSSAMATIPFVRRKWAPRPVAGAARTSHRPAAGRVAQNGDQGLRRCRRIVFGNAQPGLALHDGLREPRLVRHHRRGAAERRLDDGDAEALELVAGMATGHREDIGGIEQLHQRVIIEVSQEADLVADPQTPR